MTPPEPVKSCIHCQRYTAGFCPRCKEYSCIRQVCLDAHYAKCPEPVAKIAVTSEPTPTNKIKPPQSFNRGGY